MGRKNVSLATEYCTHVLKIFIKLFDLWPKKGVFMGGQTL